MKPIELSDNQIDVMGRPCFNCAHPAQILIAAGIYSDGPKKAEYEQAVFIHWSMGVLEEHGDKWMEVANKKLKELAQSILAKQKETESEH